MWQCYRCFESLRQIGNPYRYFSVAWPLPTLTWWLRTPGHLTCSYMVLITTRLMQLRDTRRRSPQPNEKLKWNHLLLGALGVCRVDRFCTSSKKLYLKLQKGHAVSQMCPSSSDQMTCNDTSSPTAAWAGYDKTFRQICPSEYRTLRGDACNFKDNPLFIIKWSNLVLISWKCFLPRCYFLPYVLSRMLFKHNDILWLWRRLPLY